MNDANTAKDCTLADYYQNAVPNRAIFLGTGNNDWLIEGCRFLATTTRTFTGTVQLHSIIQAEPPLTGVSAVRLRILDNNIGGDVAGTGMWSYAGTIGHRWIAIDVSTHGSVLIEDNLISNLSFETSIALATFTGAFSAINIGRTGFGGRATATTPSETARAMTALSSPIPVPGRASPASCPPRRTSWRLMETRSRT